MRLEKAVDGVHTIQLDIYFSFKIHFKFNLKFPAEQNNLVVLCANRIPLEQKKNRFPEVLCVFQKPLEQKSDSSLSGKFPSLQKSEYCQSSSPRYALLQRAKELCRSNLPLLLWSLSKLLCGKSSS
jgi:hypothetical protein